MAVYSSTIRYTGTSGIDTESLVRSLMNAESMRYNNLKAQGTKLQWKQEAYRNVATSLTSFQSTFLSTNTNSLRMSGTFRTTAASVKLNGSVSSAATVKTSAKTAAGKHTLEVLSLADKDVYVSKESVGKITGNNDVDINDYIDTATGKGAGFSLYVNGKSANIELDTDDIAAIMSKSGDEQAEEMVKRLNQKINATFGSQTVDGQPVSKASFSIDDNNKLQLSGLAGQYVVIAPNVSSSIDLLEVAGMESASTQKDTNLTVKQMFGDLDYVNRLEINGSMIDYDETTTVAELMKKINAAGGGFSLSFDGFSQKFKLESNATGNENAIDKGLLEHELFEKMGFLDDANATGLKSHTSVASDAIIKFDDVLTSSSTNNFNISEIAFTVNSKTETGQKLNIEVSKDTSSTLDTIKKFVEAYNTLIENLNGMTSQTRAKSSKYSYYEPLTDEQKEDMSDSEIEKWESKAKEGILNRDDIITGLTASMRSMLYESVSLGDGRKISLFEIGITTSTRYQDKGKLEIDETKLAEALENKAADVEKLFTKSSSISKSDPKARMKDMGVAERFNEVIEDVASRTGTIAKRAGLKNTLSEFTSDMYYKMKNHDEKVADMLRYLTDKETYYYTMFSKMESAMTKANSQASYLSSMLG